MLTDARNDALSPSLRGAVADPAARRARRLALVLGLAGAALLMQPWGVALSQPSPPGGFDVFEPATPAGSIAGVIQTKVAGQAFALDAVALNAAQTGLHTTFDGTVSVDLVDASDGSGAPIGASGCRSSWATIRTVVAAVNFTLAGAGRVSLPAIIEDDAWPHLRLRVTWVPSVGSPVVACSSDGFAVRPASFGAPVASDADWLSAGTARTLSSASASGGVVHAAGAPFRLEFSALNAAGAVTPGYRAVPALVFGGCVVPGSCSGASASSLVAPLATVAGVVGTTTATYAEAGSFSVSAEDNDFTAIDATDGTPLAQRQILSPAATIGRFVPAAWELELANTPQLAPAQGLACSTQAAWNHTWIGQPFGWATAPAITVRARGATGQLVTQVTGSLFKLDASAITLGWASNAPVSAPFSASGQTAALGALGAGTATLTLGSGASFVFTRPTTPVAPFQAAVTLTVNVADASEAGVVGNGTIPASAPLVIGAGSGIEFTGANAAGANTVLYGRLQVMSAHGDSRRALWVPYEVQAWSGAAWYRNQRDSCTQPAASSVAFSGWIGGLAACDTSVAAVTRAVRGRGWIQLAPPIDGRIGSVALTMRLAAPSGTGCVAATVVPTTATGTTWLSGPWSSAPAYASDPAGRASFGRWRVDSLVRREVF